VNFLRADILYGQAYLLANNDEVWRVFIGDRGSPLIERLTPLQRREWEAACLEWDQTPPGLRNAR